MSDLRASRDDIPAPVGVARLHRVEHARPPRPRARQAGGGLVTPAAAPALAAGSRGLGHQNFALPAADDAGDDVARRDGPLPRPRAPRARLRSVIYLRRLAHLSPPFDGRDGRSEEHTSELQSRVDLVCRLLLEKKKKKKRKNNSDTESQKKRK